MTQEKALQILKTRKNVFLTGEPGSGKTYLINQYIEYLRSIGIQPDVTASTGIAATHINGMTIHSWAGLGIKSNLTDYEIGNILNKPWVMKKLLSAQVLIIDEISMLDAQKIKDLNRLLSIARDGIEAEKPFGGLQVIFVGDFFQLPPVSKDKPADFAFESSVWNDLDFTVCYLTEQHRQEDSEFLEILTALRCGNLTKAHIERLKECKRAVSDENHITKLFTHNKEVDDENYSKLAKINKSQTEYTMTSSGIPFMVEKLKDSCLSPEILTLKVGVLVMFTKNKFENGETIYVNGTIGEVIEAEEGRSPVVRLKSGDEIDVIPADWSIMEKGKTLATIRQIPLRLAWAMTVHKSQGMSYDAAIVDLGKAFEHGQGYVALSRVRSLKGLYLAGFNDKALQMHPKVVIKDATFRKQSEEAIKNNL